MNRQDAIEKFGVHYCAVPAPLEEAGKHTAKLVARIHNVYIVESLGAPKKKHEYATSDEAREAALEARDIEIQKSLDRIEAWENSRSVKLRMAFARAGLKKDSAGYLDRVKKIWDTGEYLAGLQQDDSPFEVKYLPDEIKMPALLELGQKIYKVEALYLDDFTNKEQPPLTEHVITGMRLHDNKWSNQKTYDYIFEYKLDNGESFKYNHDRIDDHGQIEGSVINYHYFLSREAAEKHLSEIAQRITETVAPYLSGPKLGS